MATMTNSTRNDGSTLLETAQTVISSAQQVAGAAQQVASQSPEGRVEGAVSLAHQTVQAAPIESIQRAEQIASGVLQATEVAQQVASSFDSRSSHFESRTDRPAEAAPVMAPVDASFEGDDLDGVWRVIDAHLVESLGRCWEATLDLACDDVSFDVDAMLGIRAQLRWHRDGALPQARPGLVRRVEDHGVFRDRRVVRVVLVPSLWTLSQRVDCRIFQDLDAQQIVQAVLRDAGLYASAQTWTLSRTLPRREYCVQHRESDLDFVTRLLCEEGITWWVAHDEHDTVVFTDRPGVETVLTFDGEPVSVHDTDSRVEHAETLRRFGRQRELAPTSVTVGDHDFTQSRRTLRAGAPPEAGERPVYAPGSEATTHRYAVPRYGADNVRDLATVRHEANVANAWHVAGEGNVSGMAPGRSVIVSGNSHAAHDGRYLVTHVEHWMQAPEELLHAIGDARARGRERYACRVRCLPGEVQWRAQPTASRPVIAGLQRGRVVGRPDHEIDPDEQGRVKVEFFWDRRGFGDHRASAWLRVMMGAWAGEGFGMVFVPRVGMEVAVSFLDGNPDRPVVVGALFNPEQHHPYALPEEKTRSVIRTRSTPHSHGYNELRFEDLADHEEVFLRAQRDHNTQVLHDRGTTVGHDHHEHVGHDQTLSVGHDRQTSITNDETVHVGQDRRETVVRDEHVTVQRHREVRIDQHEALTVGGTRHVEVTGDDVERYAARRQTTVHGGDALTVEAGPKTAEVRGAYDITVDDRFRVVRGQSTVLVDQNIRGETAGIITLTTAGNFVRIEPGGQVSVSAQQRLTLSCGGARIELTHDGKVTVTGSKHVQLASSASTVTVKPDAVEVNAPNITASADGTHEISGAIVRVN